MVFDKSALMEEKIKWWKDRKLLAGTVLIILSTILGFYGKAVFIAKFFEPVGLLTGLSIWAFSFVLLFLGVFLVGWETVKIIQYRIHHHVKKTVKGTYDYTKALPKKSFDKLTKTSKDWMKKYK